MAVISTSQTASPTERLTAAGLRALQMSPSGQTISSGRNSPSFQGMSYASVEAAVVFAKDKLARFCSEHGIAYVHYESLADVGAFIDETIRRERAWPPAAAAASA